MVRPPSPRRVLPAALVLLAALGPACSSSPHHEKPREGVATIHPCPRGDGIEPGAVPASSVGFPTQIAGVDDAPDVSTFDGTGIEVRPGHHRVRALVANPTGGAAGGPVERLAIFDAVAGRDYELRGRASTITPPAGFDVWDVLAAVAVASSDPRAEECVTASLEWDGRRWNEADWDRTATRVTATFLPPDALLSAWHERVDLEYFPSANPLGLDDVREVRLKQLDTSCDDAWQQPLESAPGLEVFTWGGVPAGGGQEQGVTCLRSSPQGYHALSYAVRGTLTAPVATAWATRFKHATLVPPTR